MPSFNKGVFKGVRFETKPVGRFRVISSWFRWYRHYSPGDNVTFSITLKSLENKSGGFRIQSFEDGKNPQFVINIEHGAKEETTKLPSFNLPGYGTIDYRMKAFNDETYVTLVSIKATHNEVPMSITITALISLMCVIIAWLLKLVEIQPFWKIWIP